MDSLPLVAQTRDTERDHVARFQINWRRLLSESNSWRRTGTNDVARIQGHEAADVADQKSDVKHHRTGIPGLEPLPIHIQPHVERLRVRNLVGRDQIRANRSEGVASLALVPLATAFQLIFALGQVVYHTVAGDMP